MPQQLGCLRPLSPPSHRPYEYLEEAPQPLHPRPQVFLAGNGIDQSGLQPRA